MPFTVHSLLKRLASVHPYTGRPWLRAMPTAWLSRSLTSYYRPITAPTLILQAPAGLLTDSDCILTREEGEQLAIAIPNARLIAIANADHYTILFRHNPEAIREVQ